MSGLPVGERLRQIVAEIRGLPDSGMALDGIAQTGAELLKEAVGLGAFAPPEYAQLRLLLQRPPAMIDGLPSSAFAAEMCANNPGVAAWDTAIGFLFPDEPCRAVDLGRANSWIEACGPVADAIEAEAERLQPSSEPAEIEAEAGQRRTPDDPEYIPPNRSSVPIPVAISMNEIPFSRGFSLSTDSSEGGIDRDFLKDLEARLLSILTDLAAGQDLTEIQLRVRQLCDDVTHSENAEHRIGVEKNKLLQPKWAATWLRDRQVYFALFLDVGQIAPKEHAEYLCQAFRQLVRFVAEGKNDHFRRRIAPDLCGAVGDYLSLRGHAVPPWPTSDVPAEPIEWSRLIGYKELRESLHVSQNALKDRLIEGIAPVSGRIRHKKAKPKARKIQVVIADLPADLQARLRPRGNA